MSGGARSRPAARDAAIHVGIGGWTYPPWRGSFYPKGLAHERELEFASRAVTAIEINATYHRLQPPGSFAKWAASVPAGFVFAVKASRICTNRKNLAEVGEAVERFFAQGVTELGDKLGPILWQLMPTKRFDPAEIRAFLALLPKAYRGIALRHALEVRHESFRNSELLAMARTAGVAVVFGDSPEYPHVADCTADFVYARLRNAREEEPAGYSAKELEACLAAAREWAAGRNPPGLPYVDSTPQPASQPREVFLFFIDGAKVRAPAAAQALLALLESPARDVRRTGVRRSAA
ncbi:MAG TPA: DUF72 domain-containing protein [Candidatus Limnocylindrales bacterium]|nr:DUF72 domain-containing protein [Candidatus Limnocylindrales bacterium]